MLQWRPVESNGDALGDIYMVFRCAAFDILHIWGAVKSMGSQACVFCLLPSMCTPIGLGFNDVEMVM